MTEVLSLWLPILLSSVVVFLVSAAIHMASPWHKNDYPKLAREGEIMDALRPFALPPGDYMMPRPSSMDEMKTPEFAALRARGPVAVMTVFPSGAISMGPQLGQWFVYTLVVGFCAAYVASAALPAGPDYPSVFRFVGTTAFLGYAGALWQMSIWYGRSWGITLKSTIDGLLYALLTAGVFGWLWPR